MGFYFAFDALGAGQGLVAWIQGVRDTAVDGVTMEEEVMHGDISDVGWKSWVARKWDEGERRVEKVGRRYGIMGFEKGSTNREGDGALTPSTAAGKVTNAAASYVVVKVGRLRPLDC